MMIYNFKKGFTCSKPHKLARQKFLTGVQVKKLLDEVIRQNNKFKRRDHCALNLGFHFGLRIAECAILNRDSFRDIAEAVAHLRTLKQSEKIKVTCPNPDCERVVHYARKRSGQKVTCSSCGRSSTVPYAAHDEKAYMPPEKEPPAVERYVIAYIEDYMKNVMRPDQYWLFEGRKGEHISSETLRKMFSHYILSAGFDPLYSWHSLRHGRGVVLWERFEDSVMVRDMLRQKSISSTEMYLHLSPAKAEETRRILDEEGEKSNLAANPFN